MRDNQNNIQFLTAEKASHSSPGHVWMANSKWTTY